MESILKVENLKYKDILKDITFSLEENSFNILVGQNGSGKTTLVNAIRGLIKVEGNIIVLNNNIDYKKKACFYKDIGFFVSDEIYFEDNIFNELLGLLINLKCEQEKAKKRIYSIAKKFDITSILFKNINELLGYERTLVAFFFSIIHEPKLLIIDNDLENLNEFYKDKIFNYIKNQKKITTLFITTNSTYFCKADQIIFLKDGKILDQVSFDNLKEKVLLKCCSNLPFCIDLSNKLISYGLLENIILDAEEMVNEIWE